MTDHFRRKSLFFQDTRDHPKHDAKNRLSSPSPGPEKPLAEIDRLKENRPKWCRSNKVQFENPSKDLYVRTTVRELILYLIFLINLCIMSLSKF